MDSLLQSAVVAAIVSAIVTPIIYALMGPLRVWREEVAHRDVAVRREIAGRLRVLRLRLRREVLTRKRLRLGGQAARTELLNREEFYRLVWRIVFPLDDPDLNWRVRKELRMLLAKLLGEWRVRYLEDVVEEPTLADPNLGFMALVEGQRHPDAPIDRLVREGEHRPEDVDEMLQGVEKALRILKGRSLVERIRRPAGFMKGPTG